ncbi:MAG: metallophosphoesterase [Faecousia sp.]
MSILKSREKGTDNREKPKARKWMIAGVVFLTVVAILVGYLCYIATTVDITQYTVDGLPCKIVHLSDVHGSFSKDIDRIARQEPDIIVVTGDLVSADQEDLAVSVDFLSQLVAIAPTYVSMGNHELAYMERTGENLTKVFESTGAVVLHENYVDIEINGVPIRLGGIYGYCLPERYMNRNQAEIDFLREFEATSAYKILLSHLPYSWSHYGITADYDIDLVLAGHSHGGQIVLPFIGGVFDPELGFFPGKISGRFDSNGTAIIVSRGLGSSTPKVPRVNNPPEIIVLEGK